jgi:1-acyl-sn-glycerol-3-phosphate acyltransferase/transcription elongation factor Elf1
MKIKNKKMDYEKVLALPPQPHKKPKKTNMFFRTLLKVVSTPDLIATKFTYREIGMERLGKKEPCLILMNHSSFIDLKIASSILYPRPFNIVCTSDGFVGKNWLMRNIGCIPTQKFITDLTLVRDMVHAVKNLKSSVLMYPEASYSFDGTATTLPDSLADCVKMLKVPLVIIRTYGAFARDPLYNNLQNRKVKVSADMEYVLSAEEIAAMSKDEINAVIKEHFSFDNFRWQQENGIKIKEKFRADYLNRVLYKCPHCGEEGKMVGKGTSLTCHACGKEYELTEDGFIAAIDGETEFSHVPDWFAWERECVKKELTDGTYNLDIPVDIAVLVNTKSLYRVGEGRLTHGSEGFHLTGCDGKIDFTQKPLSSYSANTDYYWYELGDIICIGTNKILYYCFPKTEGDFVSKTRLAAEELYKLKKAKKEAAGSVKI